MSPRPLLVCALHLGYYHGVASPEEERNTGIWLIAGGLFAAALGIVLILVGEYSHPKNLILVVAASFYLLLPVYLIGIGIKKIVAAQSSM
jgi:hypothetical protein